MTNGKKQKQITLYGWEMAALEEASFNNGGEGDVNAQREADALQFSHGV